MKRIRVFADFDDNICSEILSRLPVKSLVRFKSVCKRWQSLIRDDNYFIDLHLSQTKERSCSSTLLVNTFTYSKPTIVASLDLFKNVVPVIRFLTHFEKHERVLKPVNGLVCSYLEEFRLLGPTFVRVRNVMTGEATPWIKASIEELNKSNLDGQTIVHGFGYDNTTKEHKVICIWQTVVESPAGAAYCLEDVICMVMTIGRETYTAWRTIDDIPAYVIQGDGIFVNGSLYWFGRDSIPTSHFKNKPPSEYIGSFFQVIIAFDVATEKFKSILIPNFITYQPDSGEDHEWEGRHVFILEIDGHIALADEVNGQMFKLWIYDEDGDNKEKIANNATIGSRDSNWIEETILVPVGSLDVYIFESITGTDQLVIGMSKFYRSLYTLHLYDRKSKTFVQVETSRMPKNYFTKSDRMANFTESLLPVPKKQQQQ